MKKEQRRKGFRRNKAIPKAKSYNFYQTYEHQGIFQGI
jgi:hypothetical protein